MCVDNACLFEYLYAFDFNAKTLSMRHAGLFDLVLLVFEWARMYERKK